MLVLDGENPVSRLAFTPDGTRLVVARAWERAFQVWPAEVRTVATGACTLLPTPTTAKRVPSLAVHPSGRLAFLTFPSESPLIAVSLADGTVREVARDAEKVIVSPDGQWVIASRFDGNYRFLGFRCDPDAKMACPEAWRVQPHVPHEQLAGFVGNSQFVTIGSYRIVVRDTETGAARTTIKCHSETAVNPVTAPDGTRLAMCSSTQFYLWDTATWVKTAQIGTEWRPYTAYAFHPTRPIVAVIQHGQTLVKFLDAKTAEVVAKFRWKLGEMRAVAFSPDGTLVAAGSVSGKIVVWDMDE